MNYRNRRTAILLKLAEQEILEENKIFNRMYKIAQLTIDSPQTAGKSIAAIIRFLLRKIEFAKRFYSVQNLKEKIIHLDEYEMANKRSPATASLGQAITFIKTILNGKPPFYIRSVLNEVIRNL